MKIKYSQVTTVIMAALFLLAGIQVATAGEVDVLIKKLVEKRILTKAEAEDLVSEMQKESARTEKEIRQSAVEPQFCQIDQETFAA